MSGAHNLRCEFQANPINIGTDSPLLSWELDRDCETGQAACRVRVFRMTPAETETGPKKAADEAWTEELDEYRRSAVELCRASPAGE